MAEEVAATPSASDLVLVDDEGPVMDKHGNVTVDGIVIEGALAKPTMNGPSKKGTNGDLPPERKPLLISNLPNGCINHSKPEDGISLMTSSDQGDIAKDSNTCIEHKCDTDQSDIKNNASNLSSEATEVHDNPSPPAEPIESVSSALSNVTISEIPEGLSGDGIKFDCENGIEYVVYESEVQMPDIMRLITKDLSEPYSIYTYRYFIHNWPRLCFLAMEGKKCVGAIVCKLDLHKKMVRRGYIAMLAVDQSARRKGIGSHLVMKAIRAMVADDCDEVVLETEITNKAALHLYENLGFVRDKRLFRYYLNGVDALRLKLWLR